MGSVRMLRTDEALLTCGVVLAPVFYIVVLIQMATRTGFDITRHAISSLSLGDAGWIQITNFVTTGTLAILFAIGVRWALRGGKAGTAAPLLIGLYGLGMIMAGVFPPDAALGFPPGTPDEMPATMSTSATLHSIAFFTAFTSLVITCYVFRRRFTSQGEQRWAKSSIAVGIAAPVLIALGTAALPRIAGVFFFIVGLVAFGWLSAVAARLLAERKASQTSPAEAPRRSLI